MVNAIAKLKVGKINGIDDVMAKHVLNCHQLMYLHLSAFALRRYNAIIMNY